MADSCVSSTLSSQAGDQVNDLQAQIDATREMLKCEKNEAKRTEYSALIQDLEARMRKCMTVRSKECGPDNSGDPR